MIAPRLRVSVPAAKHPGPEHRKRVRPSALRKRGASKMAAAAAPPPLFAEGAVSATALGLAAHQVEADSAGGAGSRRWQRAALVLFSRRRRHPGSMQYLEASDGCRRS